MATHLHDAIKCPKCGTPGKLISNRKHDEDGIIWDLTEYMCDVKLCLWLNTSWIVQSDPNGLVYERNKGNRGMDKTFVTMSQDQLAFGRMIVEDAIGKEDNR